LDITPFTILVLWVSSVPWQNGRILGELEVNTLHGNALQLEKYSAKGSGIWQNGRILFEKACQTGSNFQIFLRF
jgi:hypothetical protein